MYSYIDQKKRMYGNTAAISAVKSTSSFPSLNCGLLLFASMAPRVLGTCQYVTHMWPINTLHHPAGPVACHRFACLHSRQIITQPYIHSQLTQSVRRSFSVCPYRYLVSRSYCSQSVFSLSISERPSSKRPADSVSPSFSAPLYLSVFADMR